MSRLSARNSQNRLSEVPSTTSDASSQMSTNNNLNHLEVKIVEVGQAAGAVTPNATLLKLPKLIKH